MTPPAAPSHGAPARGKRLAIAAGAVVVVAVGTAFVWPRHSATRHHAAAQLSPTVVATTPATPTPTPVNVRAVPHEFVAPAAPTSFVLTGRKFTIKARVCGMPNVRPLDPPGEQHHTVCWVNEDFGVAPGSATGTTYVLGHSWAQDKLEVLNKASEVATREVLHGKPHQLDGVPVYPVKNLNGYKLVLKTRTGTLTYKVRSSYGVDKMKLGNIKSALNERIHNRIVVITCAELNGVDYEYNIVLNAFLYSSVKKAHKI